MSVARQPITVKVNGPEFRVDVGDHVPRDEGILDQGNVPGNLDPRSGRAAPLFTLLIVLFATTTWAT